MPIPNPGFLDKNFYLRTDIVQQARELLGCKLFTLNDGILTSGIIVETEAYAGIHDRASHAYGGRRTARTEVMYRAGGIAYVYLCYGMYHLFNVVTGPEGVPNAILIRAISPLEGIDVMMKRRGRNSLKGLADGPGKLSIAMGINSRHNAITIDGTSIGIHPHLTVKPSNVLTTPRIGIDYAGEDALLPYRFMLKI
jgi:DNA-3-methyladenine glycosylase